MNQGLWMGEVIGCLNDGEMTYDSSSRIEPKRSHQWFMDGPEADLFPNKKLAVEVPNTNLLLGMLNSNISPWGNASGFHSIPGSFTERLFDSETARAVHFDDRSISSITDGKMNVERKGGENLFGNDPSFGLSMSHTVEDPRFGLTYGGIRKVKVSQVKDSENVIPVSVGHAYHSGDNNTISASHACNKADISVSLTYNKEHEHIISMGHTYGRGDKNYISMSQSYVERDDRISMGQPCKEKNDTTPPGHILRKGDSSMISMCHMYSNGEKSTIAIDNAYNKRDESALSMGHIYKKGDESTISIVHTYSKGGNNLSTGHSYRKGDSSTIISFGDYDDEDNVSPSGRLICSYASLMSQPEGQRSESMSENKFVKSNADILASNTQITASGLDIISKKKEVVRTSKKSPPNNFPSNVRSLLSTGMLDGVHVKYISWSREELRGVIKGSGYLCGCQSCNLLKVINAFEFERHAGCKTKHPNNHIYFENGKTIYGIVQELRSTPQNMLFEIIQTITSSPINQKSFRLWKESFLAATWELQRIYGKDEGEQFS